MVKSNFLKEYLEAFESIQGFFSPDAALMFMAYNSLNASEGISGDVLEIGVHHGLSAIAVASLRGGGRQFYAIDLFDNMQSHNTSHSGSGNKAQFLRNMKSFYENIDFVRPLSCLSGDLKASNLGSEFSFCHIDGGHSARETYKDLDLCSQILVPGGLMALDDYFNPSFPGVCEGAIRFMLDHENAVKPIAIGFNKVLFQKLPVPFDINDRFASTFPQVPKAITTLWESPVYLFGSGFLPFLDLARSTPHDLVANAEFTIKAIFEPQVTDLKAKRGQTVHLPVRVVNRSTIPFQFGNNPFGLSYHLLTSDGRMLQFDNYRSFFRQPLKTGEDRVVDLSILPPEEAGSYQIEVDIVWEGITWLKERGNQTVSVNLVVT